MKKLALVVTVFSLVAVWGVLLPIWYMFLQFPPEKTLVSLVRFGCSLPSGTTFLLTHLTMGKLYVLALLLSAVIVWLGVGAQRNAKLFAGQAGLVAGWCLVVAFLLFGFLLPLFTSGELVCGSESKGPKSEFTQIQFITDSLSLSHPRQLFMQREGDKEVSIPSADGEAWSRLAVASGTNKAFVLVRIAMPQQTNTPPEPPRYWWPSRAVEISLPMTNQPLTNYTIRTLWTCKPTNEVVKGETVSSGINPTWDGRYLTVDVRLYQPNTNGEVFLPCPWPYPTCIYDVEQSKFLNFPPAKE
ncbi:MAG: hypothetical protein WCN95_11345 [bacterium]